jgi:hypothetical protein
VHHCHQKANRNNFKEERFLLASAPGSLGHMYLGKASQWWGHVAEEAVRPMANRKQKVKTNWEPGMNFQATPPGTHFLQLDPPPNVSSTFKIAPPAGDQASNT